MTAAAPDKSTLEAFAALLEYPCGGEAGIAAGCADSLAGAHPAAASLLREVGAFHAETPRGRLEEIFTATFDLQATCAPYVGHHLFGEGYKRRVFLAKLNELYAAFGFSAGSELSDHAAVVLRFLAAAGPDEEARVVREDGLLPALTKMIGAFGDSGNPYGKLLRALEMILAGPRPRDPADGPGDRPEAEVSAP